MPHRILVLSASVGAGHLRAAANNIATLGFKVNALLKDHARLEQLRANVRRIARPRAAFDVVEKSLEILKGQ